MPATVTCKCKACGASFVARVADRKVIEWKDFNWRYVKVSNKHGLR